MKALFPIVLLGIIAMSFTSCSPHQPEWQKEINGVSKLFCQAKQLKEARFELADSMRFIQDSLSHQNTLIAKNAHQWEANLKLMEERKLKLAETSRDLSDTIRHVLYNLTNDMSLDEKRIFNDSLTIHSERTNCTTFPIGQNK